jgi:hypothetical protein
MGYAAPGAAASAGQCGIFRAVYCLNPDYPTSHYNLAYALLELQRPAEAIPHAQAALKL